MTTILRRTIITTLIAGAVLGIGISAQAQPFRGHAVVVPRSYVYGGFYDPFWGPYYPYGAYGYPYGAGIPSADVRVQVTPKQAEVFVDGYYAGNAGDFDGVFKRLHTTPGGHAITLHLEGYRTVTRNIYVRPGSTFKMQDTLEQLAAGEQSAPPPAPAGRTGAGAERRAIEARPGQD